MPSPRQDQRILELVQSAKNGNKKAFDTILRELEPELRKIASRWYIIGSDSQDVMQEGRIGLWKAVQDFDETKNMSFRNFAINLCAKRNVITALTAAQRKKYDHHNNSISLDTPIHTGDDDNEQNLADFIPDTAPSMLEDILIKEEFEELRKIVIKRFTQLELAVFEERRHEESYKDMSDELGINSKAIDNALMRIRKKCQEAYLEYLNLNEECDDYEDMEEDED